MQPQTKQRMVRVSCPALVTLRDGSNKPCNAFLFEAAPVFAAYIVKKCSKCHNHIEIRDIHKPVVLKEYESPNIHTFYIKH